MQVEETLVGLEVGVVFGQREQRLEGAGQHVLRARLLVRAALVGQGLGDPVLEADQAVVDQDHVEPDGEAEADEKVDDRHGSASCGTDFEGRFGVLRPRL
ncbi:MAG: hypothetical protein IID48_10955 [Proteobacteria bacterium]|nr:hypothetical protein [Pseudomonadota bacterium]